VSRGKSKKQPSQSSLSFNFEERLNKIETAQSEFQSDIHNKISGLSDLVVSIEKNHDEFRKSVDEKISTLTTAITTIDEKFTNFINAFKTQSTSPSVPSNSMTMTPETVPTPSPRSGLTEKAAAILLDKIMSSPSSSSESKGASLDIFIKGFNQATSMFQNNLKSVVELVSLFAGKKSEEATEVVERASEGLRHIEEES
jgi:hypothetical protein